MLFSGAHGIRLTFVGSCWSSWAWGRGQRWQEPSYQHRVRPTIHCQCHMSFFSYANFVHTSLALEIARARSSGTLDSKSTRAWATASSVSSAGAALAFWILCEAMIVLYTTRKKKVSVHRRLYGSIHSFYHPSRLSIHHPCLSIAAIHIHISPIVIYIRFRTRKRESTLTDASLTSFSLLESPLTPPFNFWHSVCGPLSSFHGSALVEIHLDRFDLFFQDTWLSSSSSASQGWMPTK